MRSGNAVRIGLMQHSILKGGGVMKKVHLYGPKDVHIDCVLKLLFVAGLFPISVEDVHERLLFPGNGKWEKVWFGGYVATPVGMQSVCPPPWEFTHHPDPGHVYAGTCNLGIGKKKRER